MSDFIGLAFFILLIVGVFVGLKILAKPRKISEEDFEKSISESSSMMSAGINALNEAINPESAKAKEVVTQLKEGRFDKKQTDGDEED